MRLNKLSKYVVLSTLLLLLINYQTLIEIRFSKTVTNAPVVDPSGYYNLTHPQEQEVKQNNETLKYLVFGLPAVLFGLGITAGLYFTGLRKKLISHIVFFTTGFLLYTVLSYTTFLLNFFTLTLAIFTLPIFGFIGMLIYQWLFQRVYHLKFKSNIWFTAFLTLVVLALLFIFYFINLDLNMLVLSTVVIWQLMFLYAVIRSQNNWEINFITNPDKPIDINHAQGDVGHAESGV